MPATALILCVTMGLMASVGRSAFSTSAQVISVCVSGAARRGQNRSRWHLIRHPIYTGVLTAVAGLALAVPNVIALIALAAVLAGLELQVRRVEEPHLKRAHGDRYEAYARVAGRFVPRVQFLRLLVSRKDTISE